MADDASNLKKSTDPTPEPVLRTDDAEIARYRNLLRPETGATARYMEISDVGIMRRAWRVSLWVGALAGVVAVFVYLFYHFTNDLRIALVVVTAMLIYMIAASVLAEGRLEE